VSRPTARSVLSFLVLALSGTLVVTILFALSKDPERAMAARVLSGAAGFAVAVVTGIYVFRWARAVDRARGDT